MLTQTVSVNALRFAVLPFDFTLDFTVNQIQPPMYTDLSTSAYLLTGRLTCLLVRRYGSHLLANVC